RGVCKWAPFFRFPFVVLFLLSRGHGARVPAADRGGWDVAAAAAIMPPPRPAPETAHGRRDPQECNARAPRRYGMAADTLSGLRGQDAAVRRAERARHRADALCARRDPARP